MPLIDFKSNLSNFRKVIKPKTSDSDVSATPVPFGEYSPITSNLNEYSTDRYSFSTKKLESFERKKINEKYDTPSILDKDSIFDNVSNKKEDLKQSKVVDYTVSPNTAFGDKKNNEESPIRVNKFENKQDKEDQAKTIPPVSQTDRTSNLVSKYEMRNKQSVAEPKKLESLQSKYDIDGTPKKMNIGGKYETEKESRFGFLASNKPTVNAFDDKFSSGFKIKTGANFTQNAFNYAWDGGKENGPAVDFFPNTYTKGGFKKFQKPEQTQFKLDTLPAPSVVDVFSNKYSKNFKSNQKETAFTPEALNYTKPSAVDVFDNKYSKNFVINAAQYQSAFTSEGLNFGLSQLEVVNYFDLAKTYTIGGFIKNQKLYQTDFNKFALDYGLQGKNPSVNYFDLNSSFTKTGFTLKQLPLTTDFNTVALDWGLQGKYPTTDYFDLRHAFTNTGFTFKQRLLETDFNPFALDYGLQGKYPTTDFFDLRHAFTNTGFTFRQPLLTTDFNASALDWGLKGLNPSTDFFDLNKNYTIGGFVIRQALLTTDFNASALDWGLKGTNPSTDFFDLNKTYTISGFTIRQALLTTDFNTSALDWGLKGLNPTTDFFDQIRQYTIAGFVARQPLLTTDFNAAALDWGLKGTNPATDFFDLNKTYTVNGFVIRQPLLTTDFNASALDWGLQGTNPATDFFDLNKTYTISGFTIRQALLTTDFNASALDWGLKGTNPATDFFDLNKNYTIGGFVIRQALLTTDFNAAALDWGLKGVNPTTDFFDQIRQYTIAGFVARQALLTTDFNAAALDWGLKGTNPATDFFDLNNTYTVGGFVIRQPLLTTDFNASALDWGLQGTNPSTNFFDIPNNFTIGGFVIRQPFRVTDYNANALNYSVAAIPPLESGQPSAIITPIAGKNYLEVNFFDQANQFTTKGFHVLARPFEPTSYKTASTGFFTVPASDFEIPRIGSPVHRLDSQLVKSPLFSNSGFIKANNNTYSELIRGRNFVSFLGDISTVRLAGITGTQSLLDVQYEKYDLKEESHNTLQSLIPEINVGDLVNKAASALGLNNLPKLNLVIPKFDARQPYIIRGIQKAGQVENERWGFSGITLDEGLVRGGATTALDRTASDVFRLLQWSSTIKGVLYIVKQQGLELSNPITEASRGLIRGVLTGKKVYNPLSPLIASALSPFGIYPANRRLKIDRYEDMIQGRISDFEDDPLDSSRNVELAYDLDLLKDSSEKFSRTERDTIVLDQDDTSAAGSIMGTLSGLGGPNSLYGLGFTFMRRNSVSIPQGALQKYNVRAQYASALSTSSTALKDQLRTLRGGPSGLAPNLERIYNTFFPFDKNAPVPVVLKSSRTNDPRVGKFVRESTTTVLNIGVSGDSESLKKVFNNNSGLESSIVKRDVYTPHTIRTPFPWFRNNPYGLNTVSMHELETRGVISRRQQGFYEPFLVLGKQFFYSGGSSSSLTLNNSTLFNTATKADFGPLTSDARIDLLDYKFKIQRLYDKLYKTAKNFATPVDAIIGNLPQGEEYDDNDNLDILYYVKNLKNPLNQVVIDSQYIGNSNIFFTNKKVNDNRGIISEQIFNPTAILEHAVLSYSDIPGKYTDTNRTQVSVNTVTETLATPISPGKRIKAQTPMDLNNRKFHDFRYNVHKFKGEGENIYPEPSGRVNFVTSPEIIKYRANNLEDKAGFGKHGMPGANRTNPVLSMLCGRVSNGIRKIEGDQYGGEYIFRGDRVNLVDFRHDKSTTDINNIYELGENSLIPGTKDLIEFYVTGMNQKDRVIVFRAAFTQVQDNFQPSWETIKYLNRADPVYIYKGFEREVTLNFAVGITSRDELRTRWRSLNALAGFTAPEYIDSNDPSFNGRMKAPILKLTLGHMFRSTPCIITSLNYEFDNSQVVWETAKLTRWVDGKEIIETMTTADLDDPACCVALQLPKMINVSMTMKVLGNYRPQSNGGRTGYPDMGIFYQLYASDDASSNGLLPRKGGIYVNYMNRECTVVAEEPPPLKTVPVPPKDPPPLKTVPVPPKDPPPLKTTTVGKKDTGSAPPPATTPPPAPGPVPPTTPPPPTEPPPLKTTTVGKKDGKQSSLTDSNKGATSKSQPTRGKTGGKGNTNKKDVYRIGGVLIPNT